MKKKVLVALSGGVDSGVAAALLVQQGYDVTGVHLKLGEGKGGGSGKGSNTCCDAASFGRVVELCEKLKVPLKVLDFSEKFANVVIHDFLDNYRRGLTPNPCVVCNREIKIGGLLTWAMANGFDYLATGHYCRKLEVRSWRSEVGGLEAGDRLVMAADQKKDQSYFLWTLNSDQVRQLLFPIGEMSKEKVQDMAKFLGLPVAEARESFDVCFIDDFTTSDPRRDPRDGRGVRPRMTTHLGNYLRQHLPPTYFKAGEVVNLGGKVVGCHFGLPLYTIGQHKGLIISIKSSNRPVFYVIKKDVVSNRLVVGSKEEAQTASFLIKDINGIDFIKSIKGVNAVTGSLCVRMRHQGALVRVKEVKKVGEALEVVLSEPVLGVAPGQSAVFYQGEELVGGGIIS